MNKRISAIPSTDPQPMYKKICRFAKVGYLLHLKQYTISWFASCTTHGKVSFNGQWFNGVLHFKEDLQTIYTLNPVGPTNIEELVTAEFRTDVLHFLDKESFFL